MKIDNSKNEIDGLEPLYVENKWIEDKFGWLDRVALGLAVIMIILALMTIFSDKVLAQCPHGSLNVKAVKEFEGKKVSEGYYRTSSSKIISYYWFGIDINDDGYADRYFKLFKSITMLRGSSLCIRPMTDEEMGFIACEDD